MIPTSLSLYDFGGFLCGIPLSIYYLVCLVHNRPRSPWNFSLGIGWILIILGTASSIHVHLTLPKNYGWQDYWPGLLEIGPIFWWGAFFLYLIVRLKRQKVSIQIEPLDQRSGGVWPPPPTNKV
jgi:hypothetical protein